MPANTKKVDRTSKWGNPFKVTEARTAQESVLAFAIWLDTMDSVEREAYLAPLRGKNLACWCKPGAPCHADILLKVAGK